MDITKKKVAIYSRKSKFTGKGDSINNQIEACTNFLLTKFPEIDITNDIIVFEDEGFSGANTNRPKFQEMISLIKNKQISCICCYKLDRISRNVLDFSLLNNELDKYGVSFISVTESFDTSIPIGKAMLSITSVFAQLERDTIAERIRDNMYELAKTGRWLGGTSPLGFESSKISFTSVDGKERSLFKLSPVKEEVELIKLIFDKYNELKSLTKLETYLIQNNFKSRNQNYFSRFALKSILSNPVYVAGDKNIYNYFTSLGGDFHSPQDDFDGKYALMVYNKTNQSSSTTSKKNDVTNWIIALGKHKPIISSNNWISIQNDLTTRGSKAYRRPVKNSSILSGIIKCAYCGSYMRPKLKSTEYKSGELAFNYICELKDKSKRVHCQCPNISGNEADSIILNSIEEFIVPTSKIYKSIKKLSTGSFTKFSSNRNELYQLRKQLEKNESEIDIYTKKIIHLDNEALESVNKTINDLSNSNTKLSNRIKKLEEIDNHDDSIKRNAEFVLNIMDTHFNTFHLSNLETKRKMIKTFVNSITSDGSTLTFNFAGYEDNFCELKVPQCEDSK